MNTNEIVVNDEDDIQFNFGEDSCNSTAAVDSKSMPVPLNKSEAVGSCTESLVNERKSSGIGVQRLKFQEGNITKNLRIFASVKKDDTSYRKNLFEGQGCRMMQTMLDGRDIGISESPDTELLTSNNDRRNF